MEKQIKLGRIKVLLENLRKFRSKNESEIAIPAILGIKLGILSREIVPLMEEFEKQSKELIIKYGEVIKEEGKEDYTKVKNENIQDFFKEINELLDVEFTITNLVDIKYFEGVDLPLEFSDTLVEFIKE